MVSRRGLKAGAYDGLILYTPGGSIREWSLWNNLYGAQRRLLLNELQADGKRYHESRAAMPCARLLARKDLRAEHRHKLQALLERHDAIRAKSPRGR